MTCSAIGGTGGNGQISRMTRPLSDFTRVHSTISGDVVIQQGSRFLVQIETDSNVQSLVKTTVESTGILGISPVVAGLCSHFMRIIVTMPALERAVFSGSGTMTVEWQSATDDVGLTSRATGDLTFLGHARRLNLLLMDSGNIHLTNGAASATDVNLQGSGNVVGRGFSPGMLSTNVSGTGTISF